MQRSTSLKAMARLTASKPPTLSNTDLGITMQAAVTQDRFWQSRRREK